MAERRAGPGKPKASRLCLSSTLKTTGVTSRGPRSQLKEGHLGVRPYREPEEAGDVLPQCPQREYGLQNWETLFLFFRAAQSVTFHYSSPGKLIQSLASTPLKCQGHQNQGSQRNHQSQAKGSPGCDGWTPPPAQSACLPKQLSVPCPAQVGGKELCSFLFCVSTPPGTGDRRRDWGEGRINRTPLKNHHSPECHFFNVYSAVRE